MKPLLVYTDVSVIGGCEDVEFSLDSLALWKRFVEGRYILVVSVHALRELAGAPGPVRARLQEVPEGHRILLPDSPEALTLAAAYLERGIVGPGSKEDALHVALATVGRVDVLVSWNFKHIVNLGKIRHFNAVNIELGYGTVEIRTPKEVMDDA